MHFDFAQLATQQRYKLLSAVVTPRPIAWITSQSGAGIRNAAPYSFFNMLGADPALIVIGAMRNADGSYKDTTANILETGEFVVNMVGEQDGDAMYFTCIDAPAEFDEIAVAGITTTPSLAVAPPRIASAPASMECRLYQSIDAGQTTVILGEVLHLHIDDTMVDPARLHVDAPAMKLLSRLHGAGWFGRSTDIFQMPERPVYEKWREEKERS